MELPLPSAPPLASAWGKLLFCRHDHDLAPPRLRPRLAGERHRLHRRSRRPASTRSGTTHACIALVTRRLVPVPHRARGARCSPPAQCCSATKAPVSNAAMSTRPATAASPSSSRPIISRRSSPRCRAPGGRVSRCRGCRLCRPWCRSSPRPRRRAQDGEGGELEELALRLAGAVAAALADSGGGARRPSRARRAAHHGGAAPDRGGGATLPCRSPRWRARPA